MIDFLLISRIISVHLLAKFVNARSILFLEVDNALLIEKVLFSSVLLHSLAFLEVLHAALARSLSNLCLTLGLVDFLLRALLLEL